MENKYKKEQLKNFLSSNYATKIFATEDEMFRFLSEVDKSDVRFEVPICETKTSTSTSGAMLVSTPKGEFECFPFALRSLEQRSGDTAVGHSMMSLPLIMDSMNNYWHLHKKEKSMTVHLRGRKIIQLESDRYAPMLQSELFKVTSETIHDLYWDSEFVKGGYTHELTNAVFKTSSLPEFYKNSWKKAGLPQEDLANSAIIFEFSTADLANSAAKVEIYLEIGNQNVFMGDKISVIHKDKENSMQNFENKLKVLGVTVKEEMELLTKLMDVRISHPHEACINALNFAKIPRLAKKLIKNLTKFLACNSSMKKMLLFYIPHYSGFLLQITGKILQNRSGL